MLKNFFKVVFLISVFWLFLSSAVYSLESDYINFTNNLRLQSKQYSKITITAKIKLKSNDTSKSYSILKPSNLKYYSSGNYRNFGIEDGEWYIATGKGRLTGGTAEAGKWNSIAIIYDADNKAARLIINNSVYGKFAEFKKDRDIDPENMVYGINSTISNNVEIKDMRIYNRILTLEELESVIGQKITIDAKKYKIPDRYQYLMDFKQNKIKHEVAYASSGGNFTVFAVFDSGELLLSSDPNKLNVTKVLRNGDKFKVLEVIKNASGKYFAKVSSDGGIGYADISQMFSVSFSSKEGSPAFLFIRDFESQVESLTSGVLAFKVANIITVFVLLIILILILFFLPQIDNGLQFLDDKLMCKLGINRNYTTIIKFLPFYIAPALIFNLSFLIAFLDTDEHEWFLRKGMNIIPGGFVKGIDWVFYIMFLLFIISVIVLIIDCIKSTGLIGFIPRMVLITLSNIFAFIITFILMIIMILLFMVVVVFGGNSRKVIVKRTIYYDYEL